MEGHKAERGYIESLGAVLNKQTPASTRSETGRKHYQSHKEERSVYVEANQEKIKEWQKEYRETNKDKTKEYQLSYRAANKEKAREYHHEYMQQYRAKKRLDGQDVQGDC